MAENGKLYSKLPEDYPVAMKELIKHCDYLTPNITGSLYVGGEALPRRTL